MLESYNHEVWRYLLMMRISVVLVLVWVQVLGQMPVSAAQGDVTLPRFEAMDAARAFCLRASGSCGEFRRVNLIDTISPFSSNAPKIDRGTGFIGPIWQIEFSDGQKVSVSKRYGYICGYSCGEDDPILPATPGVTKVTHAEALSLASKYLTQCGNDVVRQVTSRTARLFPLRGNNNPPVWDCEWRRSDGHVLYDAQGAIIIIDPVSGHLVSFSANFTTSLLTSWTPKIDEASAVKIAKGRVHTGQPSEVRCQVWLEGYTPDDGDDAPIEPAPLLVWHVKVQSKPLMHVVVDARSGEIVEEYDDY